MERQTFDTQLNGWASIYSGGEDVINSARKSNAYTDGFDSPDWVGATFKSWNDVVAKIRRPWAEGIKCVQQVLSHIGTNEIPTPSVRTRQRRWSEDDGEICGDRALAGEADFFRETYRTTKHGNQNVTLLTNMAGSCNLKSMDLVWSPAAMIACVDVLESAGFSCEAWAYYHGAHGYRNNQDVFGAIKLKEAGDPLDAGALISVASGWFFRSAVLGSMHDCPSSPEYGYGRPVNRIGGWGKHLDLGNAQVVEIQACYDVRSAVAQAQKIIKQIIANEYLSM